VADLVTVISQDVRTQMFHHALGVDDERIAVVPLGTEHVSESPLSQFPVELEARGFGARSFGLVLGVNYHHKNRDLAIAAHRALRNEGFDLDLVMAGPAVPHGTSRLAESMQRFASPGADGWLHVLPEVTVAERNWLLSHASLAWYPTSAEGFGLPPFEAATFGVPSVVVGFGPVGELIGPDASGYPLLAADWSPDALTKVAVQLLRDPAVSAAHCAAIQRSGRRYSWSNHADRLVSSFRNTLSLPSRTRR
jgi:glycosyltransferase involved in cell wall biosynthesis